MKRTLAIALGLLVCASLVVSFAGGVQDTSGATVFLKIGAGPEGAASYSACAKISEIIHNNIPNTSVSVIPGGNVTNARLVAVGELDMGWTTVNCAYFAYEGMDPYKEVYKDLRFLATCDTSVMQLAVARDSDIDSYKDLYNKRINSQQIGSNTRMSAEVLLNLYGITFDSIKENGGVVHTLGTGEAATMMQDKKMDAMFAFGGYLPAFLTVAERPGIRLVGLDEEIIDEAMKHPLLRGTFKTSLPAGVYKGCDGITSIGIQKLFVVNKKMSDSLAYEICKLVYESDDLKSFFEGATKKGFPPAFTVEDARKGAAIPVHDGAERYIRERGY